MRPPWSISALIAVGLDHGKFVGASASTRLSTTSAVAGVRPIDFGVLDQPASLVGEHEVALQQASEQPALGPRGIAEPLVAPRGQAIGICAASPHWSDPTLRRVARRAHRDGATGEPEQQRAASPPGRSAAPDLGDQLIEADVVSLGLGAAARRARSPGHRQPCGSVDRFFRSSLVLSLVSHIAGPRIQSAHQVTSSPGRGAFLARWEERLIALGSRNFRSHSRGAGLHTNCRSEGELRVGERGGSTGTPLLLLNGIGAHLDMWAPFDACWATGVVIALDPPGTGESPRLGDGRAGWTACQSVVEVLDELGHRGSRRLGYSFGGALAQELARRFPRRVRRLVLCATSAGTVSVPPKPIPALILITPPVTTTRRCSAG